MAEELTKEQWMKLRNVLRIIFRNKKEPYRSALFVSALAMIEDEQQREVFKRYYFKSEKISTIAKAIGTVNRVVCFLLLEAVKTFVLHYAEEHLLKMFKDGNIIE